MPLLPLKHHGEIIGEIRRHNSGGKMLDKVNIGEIGFCVQHIADNNAEADKNIEQGL